MSIIKAVRIQAQAPGTLDLADKVLDHLDDVIDELGEIDEADDRIHESDVSAHLAEGTVEFSFLIEAEDDLDAITIGVAAVRSAIHAAHGKTPGWELLLQRTNVVIGSQDEPIADADCVPA